MVKIVLAPFMEEPSRHWLVGGNAGTPSNTKIVLPIVLEAYIEVEVKLVSVGHVGPLVPLEYTAAKKCTYNNHFYFLCPLSIEFFWHSLLMCVKK